MPIVWPMELFLKGDRLEKLCEKINADPDDEQKMEVAALEQTLKK